MKKITKLITLMLCLAMLAPLFTFAGSNGVKQNPDIAVPETAPVIDGVIENNGYWSEAASHSEETAGYFWGSKSMTSEAKLYFAYSKNYLYFAANIFDNDNDSGMVYSTGYDTDDYGFNGDVMTLMLDPLGAFEKTSHQTTPWYNVGIFEDGTIGVYRTNVNDEDITSSVLAKGNVTAKGWRFEIAIPWSMIYDDVAAITDDEISLDYVKLYSKGSVTRASAIYMDRYKMANGQIETWGRFITVCDETYDGYPGVNTSGTNAKSYGLILKNAGVPEHYWGPWTVTKEATCKAEGSRERVCTETGCGSVEKETIAKTDHTYETWVTIKESTSTTDGLKKRVCTVCEFVETKVIPANGDQLIVAYFNVSAGIASYEFENIDVLNYHPASVSASATSNPALGTIVKHDYTYRYQTFRKVAKEQNPDIKFLFTVANNNLTTFESWFYNQTYAAKLAQEMTIIIEENDYDGLDIDYEFPTGAQHIKDNFVFFMKCMRENLDALSAKNGKEYFLSMAVPGTSWTFSLFDMPALAQHVDYFNMMNYDLYIQHGTTHHHTPTYDNDASSGFVGGSVYSDIQLYLQNGIPANKIVAGCGLYALRYYNVPNVNNGLYQPGTRDNSNLHYTELKYGYENRNGYVKYWDEKAQASYLYNAEQGIFITYDDERSVEAKCKVVAEQGVRGIMVFDYCTTDGIGLFDNMRGWLDTYAKDRDILDSFTDINKSQWYAEGVRYCVENGYMAGTSNTKFNPNGNLTREQFVTILARVAGANLDKYYNKASAFTDVKVNSSTEWYYPAIAWAKEMGYVNGVGNGSKFGVGQMITREQIATMFSRYAQENGIDISKKADLSKYTDKANISDWAYDACAWAVNAALIGSTDTSKLVLAPQMTVTRAQAAKIFMSYDSLK